MIQLRALGVLDLQTSDNVEIRQILAQPKRAALLAYLLLASPGRSHPRDKLLAIFWPDQDAEHARNALSQAVHFLRRALGDDVIVNVNGDALGVAQATIWSDVSAFDDAVRLGRLAEALALYRGDFLEGFHVANAPEFDRWMDGERRRHAERFEATLDAIAAQCSREKKHAEAAAYLRRLAARAPYNSPVALKLMRALAAGGDPAAAVQHAQVHERLLRAELDIPLPSDIASYVAELQRLPAIALQTPRPPVSEKEPATAPVTVRRWPARRAIALGVALVVVLGAATAAIAKNGLRGDPGRIRSIAVLPFEYHSPDTSRRYFADGLHDLLITELAKYAELNVLSRGTVMQYRGTRKTVPEIAAELNVDGVVEGSVQQEGNGVRVIAQLVHASDRHVWADDFRGELSDPLTLQETVADAIAREVQVAALPRRETPRRSRSAALEIYLTDLIKRGKTAEASRTESEVYRAKDAYQRAVREDSTYAPAVAALSNIHTVIARYSFGDVHAALDTAHMLALRAVQLDSTLSAARAALAVSLADNFQFDAADREFRAAIQLSPSNADAHQWYAMFLAAMGRGVESLSEARRALALDPFALRGYYITLYAADYLATGERKLYMAKPAGTRWAEFIEHEPGEPWGYRADAYDLAEAGKCDAARTQIAKTAELAPRNIQTLVALANIEWWCGDKAKAHAMLEKVKHHPNHLTHGKIIAFAHAWWGEIDSAFVWANKGEWRFGSLMDLRAIRFTDEMRTDPRYLLLLKKLHLTPTERERQAVANAHPT